MANLGRTVQSQHVETQNNFELIQPGWYEVKITDSEMRTSNAGNQYLSLTYEIIGAADGGNSKFVGRLVFESLSLFHSDAKVSGRAWETLQNLGNCVGVAQYDDSSALHNRPFQIKVGTQKGKNGYEDKSVAREYAASQAAATPPQGAPAQQVPPTPPMAQSPVPAQPAPPWQQS